MLHTLGCEDRVFCGQSQARSGQPGFQLCASWGGRGLRHRPARRRRLRRLHSARRPRLRDSSKTLWLTVAAISGADSSPFRVAGHSLPLPWVTCVACPAGAGPRAAQPEHWEAGLLSAVSGPLRPQRRLTSLVAALGSSESKGRSRQAWDGPPVASTTCVEEVDGVPSRSARCWRVRVGVSGDVVPRTTRVTAPGPLLVLPLPQLGGCKCSSQAHTPQGAGPGRWPQTLPLERPDPSALQPPGMREQERWLRVGWLSLSSGFPLPLVALASSSSRPRPFSSASPGDVGVWTGRPPGCVRSCTGSCQPLGSTAEAAVRRGWVTLSCHCPLAF